MAATPSGALRRNSDIIAALLGRPIRAIPCTSRACSSEARVPEVTTPMANQTTPRSARASTTTAPNHRIEFSTMLITARMGRMAVCTTATRAAGVPSTRPTQITTDATATV
jgi:hypothetical protein